ncbi:MAG TPA: hypothetical protein PLQ93_08360 [Bacteroidia bacterium]|nr:hypothetical protein [Bacteroidia bacterium]
MNPERVYKISGYLSLVFGILASLTIYKRSLLIIGMPLTMLGLMFSVLNIFLGTRHGFEGEKFSKGYLGMFLSSLPLIFILVMNFLAKPR